MNKKIKKISVFLITLSLFLTTGFSKVSLEPKSVYRVYLKGESLGIINSKQDLENFIDKKQEEIKKKYNVKNVYLPTDLDIVKEITYKENVKTTEEIYDEIKDKSPFTINGYVVKIKGIESNDSNGKKVVGKTKLIYVLDKKTFLDSVNRTVKLFINENDYNNYANKTQKEIDDTGKIIENIYIKNKITIKKSKIPVDKKIYQTEEELSKYLLFGTTDNQKKYTINDGDTIEEVAFNNKISVDEFLIANPDLHDAKSLLSPGQEVTLGILKPQFSLVEEDHVVFREEKKYATETRVDNDKYVGYEEVIQNGVNGENKVTQKIQKVNGETVNTVTTSTEVIKESVSEIIVKGGKQSLYTGGFGSVIATKGQWGWPASCSSVSSPFGYRWGALHDAIDIAGCGYGSNLFAAMAGEVVVSMKKTGGYPGGYGDSGEYVIIDHKNGYYTVYAHMCPGCREVSVGDYVEKGQLIGHMGMTGAATGVHLHFSIYQGYPYRGGTPLNPAMYYDITNYM